MTNGLFFKQLHHTHTLSSCHAAKNFKMKSFEVSPVLFYMDEKSSFDTPPAYPL